MGEHLNQEPAPTPVLEVEKSREAESEADHAKLDVGKTAVFRAMRLDGLTIHQDEKGNDIYTVQNPNYEEGDYAFDNFSAAADYAPVGNIIKPVYALHADAADVSYRKDVEPEGGLDVVTIRNGAQVRIQQVPKEIVETHVYRGPDEEGYSTDQVLAILSQTPKK